MLNHPASSRAVVASGLIAATAFLSGCASIVHHGPRTLTIDSRPTGATVTIVKADTQAPVHRGTTPVTVSLDPKRGYFKGQSYNVRFELAGYQTSDVQIRSEMSGWYWGNIVFGGLIGMLIVDPATGAMWNLTPDKITRDLNPQQAAMLRQGDGFLIALVADTSAAERASMVRVN
ncbi:hypothetical protein [Opitutus sp. ER46]|uniref:hypothetical protein n=1 Tax=Opitutus sp. ER46 TaxID=2161864 RepID=UPI000D302839|nr:hypothetical protein [Opitutus sp. ER46]PTX95651.1 hypothetical protein DB354_09565 [Opitutus sp. ER46]